MKPYALALAATLLPAGVAHAGGLDVCDFRSDYDLRIEDVGLRFERDKGSPRRIEMRQGRLIVDSREASLSSADRERIALFESRIRQLVPEVKGIALEAIGIATEAVLQVATTFSADNSASVLKRVERLSDDIAGRIQRSNDSSEWREAEFETAIEALVQELVPAMVGDVAAVAVRVALSGDEDAARELEARAERLEQAIEDGVERRAEALEQRAEELCPQIAELDRIESGLEYRSTDDRKLDLVSADR